MHYRRINFEAKNVFRLLKIELPGMKFQFGTKKYNWAYSFSSFNCYTHVFQHPASLWDVT
jgi:hypothetical protein